MADYKAMYLAAMERAIETLTAARQRCEDLYVASSGESARPAEETDDAQIVRGTRDARPSYYISPIARRLCPRSCCLPAG